MYNRRAKKSVKKVNKFAIKWTDRRVIEHQHKDEILKMTGAKPGEAKMIQNYQGALTSFMDSLSKEEKEEAQKTADEWNTNAPPADIRANFAERKAPGLIKNLATELWRQAGMRIFVVSAWQTEEGKLTINGSALLPLSLIDSDHLPVIRLDFNERLQGKSFTGTKDWKPLLSEWSAYAGEEFGEPALSFDNVY